MLLHLMLNPYLSPKTSKFGHRWLETLNNGGAQE